MHIVEMMEEIERLFEIVQTDGLVQLILAQQLGQVVQTLFVDRQFLCEGGEREKLFGTNFRKTVCLKKTYKH